MSKIAHSNGTRNCGFPFALQMGGVMLPYRAIIRTTVVRLAFRKARSHGESLRALGPD